MPIIKGLRMRPWLVEALQNVYVISLALLDVEELAARETVELLQDTGGVNRRYNTTYRQLRRVSVTRSCGYSPHRSRSYSDTSNVHRSHTHDSQVDSIG